MMVPDGEGPTDGTGGRALHPLLEAGLVFSAFWFGRAYLSLEQGAAHDLASIPTQVGTLVFLIPATAVLLYLISLTDGLRACGIVPWPRPRDGIGALLLIGGMIIIGGLPEILRLFALIGGDVQRFFSNPLLASQGRPLASPLILIPLLLASSLTTGYAEELFFRVYLLRRLRQSGFGAIAALGFSSILFGLGHLGQQGPAGAILAGLSGLLFALRYLSKKSWHEIALGHGLYNFLVLLLVLYS